MSEEGTEEELILEKWQLLKNMVQITVEQMLVKKNKKTRESWFIKGCCKEGENRQVWEQLIRTTTIEDRKGISSI